MEKFEFIEHEGEAAFKAYGKSLEEVFKNAAFALASVMFSQKNIDEKKTEEIFVVAPDKEWLLQEFLQEVMLVIEGKNFVFKNMDLKIETKNEAYELRAKLIGEKMDPKRHELGGEIKAITWHDFYIREKNGNWEAKLVVDV